jgi:hypothetical protein
LHNIFNSEKVARKDNTMFSQSNPFDAIANPDEETDLEPEEGDDGENEVEGKQEGKQGEEKKEENKDETMGKSPNTARPKRARSCEGSPRKGRHKNR